MACCEHSHLLQYLRPRLSFVSCRTFATSHCPSHAHMHAAARHAVGHCCATRLTRRHFRLLACRGLLHDVVPSDRPDLLERVVASGGGVYAGFDPTADSLHLGHLMVLTALVHVQRAGATPVALIGGATAQLGDPSGRRSQRPLLAPALVEQNAAAIESIVQRLFNNHERFLWRRDRPLKALRVLNNNEWYGQYSLIDFMTVVGRRFRVARMLACSTVQSRLAVPDGSRKGAAGMTLAEFSYQMLQAYDWLYLWRRYGCRVQVGGSDQSANMMAGYNLIGDSVGGGGQDGEVGEAVDEPLAYLVTVPLITNEEGDKLGKSAGNVLWLCAEKTSPFDLFQYLVRTADAQVEELLQRLTFVDSSRIDEVMAGHRLDPGARVAQKLLAEQVTLFVHGEESLRSVERITTALYSRDHANSLLALQQLQEYELFSMMRHSPPVQMSLMSTSGEPLTCRQMAVNARCFANNSDADRIMAAGGFYINHERCTSGDQLVHPDQHVLPCGLSLLRVGKKNYFLVKWV